MWNLFVVSPWVLLFTWLLLCCWTMDRDGVCLASLFMRHIEGERGRTERARSQHIDTSKELSAAWLHLQDHTGGDPGLTVLYRNGEAVSAIRAPVTSADSGQEISPAFLLQVVDVPGTSVTVGYHHTGTPNIVVQWWYTEPGTFYYGMLSEADFNAVYNGTSGCREPSNLTALVNGRLVDSTYTAYLPIFEAAPPSYSSLVQPCGAPVTFYWFTSFLSSGLLGVTNVSWAAADWVAANDTTNPICPDSPTAWGYTKFAISYCPCPAQPPPPSPPPPPPMPPLPSCGDFLYVTYNGVPVTGYSAPVRSSVTGQVVTPGYIDASKGYHELMVDWQLETYVKYSFGSLPEAYFLQLYNGSTGCQPPDEYLSGSDNWEITTQGITKLDSGVLFGLFFRMGWFAQCQPFTMYAFIRFEDIRPRGLQKRSNPPIPGGGSGQPSPHPGWGDRLPSHILGARC
ncbi:hypothetical protein VOLCADRAFT_91228 [Volvox carteri f. nagariensis]|uniref:Pherophorin domain-containing protein n=1 Tax=Volvox carteri f. nagariensis TaxID=3068 RepID=D8TWI5_VOLCA|nr:uncharacterized protein VOLCADRAFT_91228 [Volvox carteri f. nagariensis]EFJ48160.1 hypothetical protein VOLCADRAFT_91228 [Volvox carteri f. nagariensis]|eukprot:XP_002950845.1 hypothetical protein VOLCADRAFT_91228 [Volvox carteri f. nagariensis]